MSIKISEVRSSMNIVNNSKEWEVDVVNEQKIKQTLIVKRKIWELDIHFIEILKTCKTNDDIKALHIAYYDKLA